MATRPIKVRCLQRKLYVRSKQEPEKRFYSLYDKLYRMDILRTAYAQGRENKGCAGIDGITFEQIAQAKGGVDAFLSGIQAELKDKSYQPQPMKRVLIPKGRGSSSGERPLGIACIKDRVVQTACALVMQPIYEPHLHEQSYGYRPKRNAQQAVQQIEQYLKQEYTQVLDADLSGYFDSIPHGRLLDKIAERISDRSLLQLMRKLLKAPIVEVQEDGKTRVKANRIGTQQGSGLSPLLANIYLNDFCILIQERTPCKIIAYADDFVILHKEPYSVEQLDWVERTLSKEGLTLNKDKTRCVDMSEQGNEFNFLGFQFKQVRGCYRAQYIRIEPSRKSQAKFKDAIRDIVKHRTSQTLDVLVERVNLVNRGWKQYFGKVGYPRKVFFKLDWFVVARFYRWSRNRSQRKSKYLAQGAYRKLCKAGLECLQPTAVKEM